MPRFTEEVQAKVDANHADTALAMESAQALFGVPPEARLAMPCQLDSDRLFLTKSKFLSKGQCDALIAGHGNHSLKIEGLRLKINRCFGFDVDTWEKPELRTLDLDPEIFSFNCSHSIKPNAWHWKYDRQITAIVWLESSEELLEFPYLKPTPESEPPRIKAKSGQILIFPSNPLYASRILDTASEVKFLILHGTKSGIDKPPSLN